MDPCGGGGDDLVEISGKTTTDNRDFRGGDLLGDLQDICSDPPPEQPRGSGRSGRGGCGAQRRPVEQHYEGPAACEDVFLAGESTDEDKESEADLASC